MMGNVRISSLHADRPVASQDCPTCINRRIICDRSKPACMKCASRGLDCPGFKAIYLKWNQGIASRGKFTGKSVPVADTISETSTQTLQYPLAGSDTAKFGREQLRIRPYHQRLATASQQNFSLTTKGIEKVMGWQVAHSFLSTSVFETLIHHFCTKAVSRLSWIGQPSHQWRMIAQCLLHRSTCVQLSAGCLAAAHLSMAPNVTSAQSSALFNIYGSLRDEALRLLSVKIGFDFQNRCSTALQECNALPATEVLASILVLCYAEMLVPGSTDWKVHLRACRTVIKLHRLEDWCRASTDPIVEFLVKETSYLETFATTTVFEDDLNPTATIIPQLNFVDNTWAFTNLICKITKMERQRHNPQKFNGLLPAINMSEWCRRIEEARERTEQFTMSTCRIQSHSFRKYFHAVISAHFYATTIYSYQAFASVEEQENIVHRLLDCLLHDLEFIMNGPTDELFQDLFFPLFIAGVESASQLDRQLYIDRLFVECLSRTGIWCNCSALQFMRIFWSHSSNPETRQTWIQFARANESMIGSFLIM